jgi:hypothetical protein
MGESHKAIGGQRELTHSANVWGKHIVDDNLCNFKINNGPV